MADIQEPTSFGEERRRAEKAGTRIVWPLSAYDPGTGEVHFAEGERIEADLVVQAVGEVPDYGKFLPDTVLLNLEGRVHIPKDSFRSTDPKIYVIGDAVTPGLITHSIGMGRLAALEIHADFRGEDSASIYSTVSTAQLLPWVTACWRYQTRAAGSSTLETSREPGAGPMEWVQQAVGLTHPRPTRRDRPAS